MSQENDKIMRKQESEKTLEARLVSEVRRRGGMAIKLTSQFHRGLPDRLVVLPYHTLAFVEMKSTGKKPTDIQEHALGELRRMKFTTRVIDSTETLDEFLAAIDLRLAQQEQNNAELIERYRESKAEFIAEQKARRSGR